MIFIHSTFKHDCPPHITLLINVSGTVLEVKSVSTEHNHEISQVSVGMVSVLTYLWQYYIGNIILPQVNIGLDKKENDKATKLLHMRVNNWKRN